MKITRGHEVTALTLQATGGRSTVVGNVERRAIADVVEAARNAGWSGAWAGVRLSWWVEVEMPSDPLGHALQAWLPNAPLLPHGARRFVCSAEVDF